MELGLQMKSMKLLFVEMLVLQILSQILVEIIKNGYGDALEDMAQYTIYLSAFFTFSFASNMFLHVRLKKRKCPFTKYFYSDRKLNSV